MISVGLGIAENKFQNDMKLTTPVTCLRTASPMPTQQAPFLGSNLRAVSTSLTYRAFLPIILFKVETLERLAIEDVSRAPPPNTRCMPVRISPLTPQKRLLLDLEMSPIPS